MIMGLTSPLGIVSSDGGGLVNGRGHPRSVGTFGRFLGRFVRDLQVVSWMEGIRKITLLPAERLERAIPRMARKGRLQVGMDADVTVLLSAAVVMALILIVTMTLSDIMNNAATAVVMAPIALSIAGQLGVSADPFLMAVAVGASCAFLTPIGHQNNTLILGPGAHAMTAAGARHPQQQSVPNRIAEDGLAAAEFSLGTHENKI